MGRFAKECVDVFCELTGYDKGKVGTAPTPFIDESKDPLAVTQTAPEAVAKAAPAGELSHSNQVLNETYVHSTACSA